MGRPSLRRFVRRLVEGAHRPPLFEADDGASYVLKLDTIDADFPVVELIAARLARAFGVPLPDFEVLDVPDVLVDALRESGDPDLMELAESFSRRANTCFGSQLLNGPTTRWSPSLSAAIPGGDGVLARLLVFDTYIENTDRTSAANPNLLACGGALYAIDHGQALPVVQRAGGKRPFFPYDSHISWPTVQAQPALLDDPIADLVRLEEGAIRDAFDAVPPSWWTDPAVAPKAIDDLITRRRTVSDTLIALRKRLS